MVFAFGLSRFTTFSECGMGTKCNTQIVYVTHEVVWRE